MARAAGHGSASPRWPGAHGLEDQDQVLALDDLPSHDLWPRLAGPEASPGGSDQVADHRGQIDADQAAVQVAIFQPQSFKNF